MAAIIISGTVVPGTGAVLTDQVVGTNCTQGQPVYQASNTGRLWPASANINSDEAQVVGLVLTNAQAAQPIRMQSQGQLAMGVASSFTGNTTNTSNVINGVTNTANVAVGMGVTGTGITANTRVTTVNNATTFVISTNATATGTITVTTGLVVGQQYQIGNTNGSIIPVTDAASGMFVTPLGVAITADIINLNINPSGVQLG